MTVTNWGVDDAGVVAIYSPFPEGLTFVDSLASRGTYDVNTGLWEIGSLPRYSAASLTLTGQAPIGSSGTTVTSTALLKAFDATPDNNSASVTVSIGDAGIVERVPERRLRDRRERPPTGSPTSGSLKTNLTTDMNDCATASSGTCSFKIVGTGKAAGSSGSCSTPRTPAGPYTLGISAKADAITGIPKVKLQRHLPGWGQEGVHPQAAGGCCRWAPTTGRRTRSRSRRRSSGSPPS